jgi:ABC-type multidrug transport system fused ATPase/permease subunit
MKVLTESDQRKIIAIVFAQILLGVFDLLGVLAIGLLGAISVAGFQPNDQYNWVDSTLDRIGISSYAFQTQAIIIATLAVVLLVGRTVLSVFFTRRIMFFLSRRGAQISADIISRMLSQSLLFVQSRTTQESLYAVTRGVQLIVIEILATAAILVSDVSLLVILAIGLFVMDPTTALGLFGVFVLIGIMLHRIMNVRANLLGVKGAELNIKSNEKIVEVFSSYREAVVRNRRDYYATEIGKLRTNLADATAELSFLPYVSKYVIETAIVLGAVIIGGIQFMLHDASEAISTLAIFLAAGTRIAPAVLRIQQGSILIRGSLGQAKPTLELINTLGVEKAKVIYNESELDFAHKDFKPSVELKNITFRYPGGQKPAVNNMSLSIPAGASVAIVGPSGAGKTTIIDILLGVLSPDSGSILISEQSPQSAINKWPGAISYVPQDVVIVSGTIRENVALGYPTEIATDDLVMRAIKIAHLENYVQELPNGLESQVGERGVKISGGQRQRLGIARAMFTQPRFLVLDEATSSLDGETEAGITDSIDKLRGSTTVFVIAHRLSTIRKADVVVYLSEGEIKATGTFDQLRQELPEFDYQATLMGL